ncbi:MAG: hypothetical protein M1489_05990 [Firmicutes bacterium]|nr:hypothetical protein [Bacillota bacterium]
MSDPTIPAVKLNLDKERNLLLDLNAMVTFEQETGKSLMEGADLSKMGMIEFRALLWACLIHEDESLTLKNVGAMVHPGNMEEVSNAIAKAFEAATPEPDGDKGPLPEARPVG